MSSAPRITERLLEALCPPSPFRDGILGDLAEEFLRRKYDHGPLAARRWYYGQALASAPYLVAHWALRATFGAWIAILACGVIAPWAARALFATIQLASVRWWGVNPDAMGIVAAAWRDMHDAYPLWTAAVVNSQWLFGALAGYLIARSHRDAPVAAAGAAAVTGSLTIMAVMLANGLPLVLWKFLALIVGAWTVSMTAGGATAALTMRPVHRQQASGG